MTAKRMLVALLLLLVVTSAAVAAPDAAPDAVIDASGIVGTTHDSGAPAIPTTVDEAVDVVKSTVNWFETEHIRAGIAGIIALLVGIWRKTNRLFIDKVPRKVLPFLVAGVAFLATVPVALSAPQWSWWGFFWRGLITSAEAMAFWSLGVKAILSAFGKKSA